MNTELKNSEEFLTNKVGRTTGFKISKNYFESLEDAVVTKLSEESFIKETGFEVPNNYFEDIEDSIFSKISSEEKTVKVISLRSRIASFSSIAAAACILLFIGLQFFNSSEANTFENLAFTDVENWAENNIVFIDNYDLNQVFESSDFDDNEFLSSEISEESIENYLTNVDISTILNEID